MNNEMLIGDFTDRTAAERAVDRLHELGYSKNDISVMMNDRTRESEFSEKTGTHAAQGAVTGAAIGGGLGAIIAGLTATGSIAAIVGTGGAAAPFVAGPLAAAIAGLGAGGVAGGVVGGLIGVGIPEHRAKEYADRLDRGAILIGVTPRADDRVEVERILEGRDVAAANRSW